MSQVQFNYLTHLLAVGKAGEPSCLFRCCLSVAVISKPPLPPFPPLFNDLAFFSSAGEVPPTPLHPMQSLRGGFSAFVQ